MQRLISISILLVCGLLAGSGCYNLNQESCASGDLACDPAVGLLVYLEALENQSEKYRDMILDESSLVGYWRFEETSGTLADELKSGRDGTYENGVTLALDGAIPGTNVAIGLYGVDDVVTVAHDLVFDFDASASFTL